MIKSDLSPNTIPAPSGDGYEYINDLFIDEDTGEEKVKITRINIYEMIQAATKTCDMNFIIAQLKKGDLSVLESSNGVYIDSTALPHDLAEAQALKDTAIGLYETNNDLKELYKNADEYTSALLRGDDIAGKVIKARLDKLKKITPEQPKESEGKK